MRGFAGISRLSPSEIRVLGCLLEKQRTTPDQYPLTLNGLRLACNQSTNRDPVVNYDDSVLRDALHRLGRRGYVRLASGAGSRAPKYRHLLAEALPMGEDEQAVMSVMMLRGPQTPGELKQRADRMHPFADLAEVHATLEQLIERELVERLPRRPGQKEERYAQLLEDRDAESTPDVGGAGVGIAQASAESVEARHTASPGEAATASIPATLAALEERVARLERELLELRSARGGAPERPERHDGSERHNGTSEGPNGNSEHPLGVPEP